MKKNQEVEGGKKLVEAVKLIYDNNAACHEFEISVTAYDDENVNKDILSVFIVRDKPTIDLIRNLLNHLFETP